MPEQHRWSDSGLTPPTTAMIEFAAHLRLHGFAIAAADAAIALSVLTAQKNAAGITARSILRLLFASDRAEWERFNELFDDYWYHHRKRIGTGTVAPSSTTRRLWNLPSADETAADHAVGSDSGDDGKVNSAPPGVKVRQQGAQRGGQEHASPPSGGAQWRELGEHLWCALSHSRSRRFRPHRRGRGVDLRRTLRRSVSAGGEPLLLLRWQRKKKPLRLSVLVDVSASMQAHSRVFLLLLKGFLRGAQAEGFVFHTHLARVTSSLREDSGAPALEKFALQTQGVGGGTRIAHCLQDFSRCYGRRCLGGRSAVLIISDGYDSQPPQHLRQAMEFLRRRTRRIFWLSPSLTPADSDAPPPQALAQAYPLLTALAPARNAADVAQAAKMWAAL